MQTSEIILKQVGVPLKKLLKLNLGCGNHKVEGFVNIDYNTTSATDLVINLDKPGWGLEKDSVDEVRMIHFLEHIHNHIPFFNELYEAMVDGGKVLIRGPHARSSGAWQDPTHTRPIPEEFFHYFNKDFRKSQGIIYAGIFCDFVVSGIGYTSHPDYEKLKELGLTQEEFEFDLKHKFNVATELHIELTARK